MMRKWMLGPITVAIAAFGVAGCGLSVENPNQPDRSRALASPSDVESLISSSFSQYFRTAHRPSDGLGPAMEVTADHNTASWGNFGMRDIGEEPRKPYNNTPSFAYAYANEDQWGLNYAAVSAASDGLRAINDGLEIGPGGQDNPRAIAFAKFTQGIAYGVLGATYDKAFLVDETTDFGGELTTSPYQEVSAFGMQKLSEAIQVANANTFTLPDTWINGNPLSNTELAQLAHSYMARLQSAVARSPSERDGLNWSAIESNVDQGITSDLIIDGINADTPGPWWDALKTWINSDPGWVRVDMHWVGQADISGGYQAYVQTQDVNRQPFNVISPDLRVPQNPGVDGDRGVYMTWLTSTLLPPGRGTYHLSHYLDHRYETYTQSCDGCWEGPFPIMTVREMRLYKAEARARMGDLQGAADIINESRVAIGGLPPITPAGTSGANCVPHKRLDPTGACGDLMDALRYEFYWEVDNLETGVTYWFTRGHGQLTTGTVLQFPIPGSELETLQMKIYTFGGVGGNGAAPTVIPGNLSSALDKVSYDLDALRNLEARDTRPLRAVKQ
ncbi:MAG: hypothetical protein ACE5HQ_08470 [Gemmatimonadota bacterium]